MNCAEEHQVSISGSKRRSQWNKRIRVNVSSFTNTAARDRNDEAALFQIAGVGAEVAVGGTGLTTVVLVDGIVGITVGVAVWEMPVVAQ